MKLAASNIGWRAEFDQTAWQLLHTYGYTGLEAAPTRLVPAPPYGRAADAAALARKLRADYGLCIPSLQSIWYGRSGNLFDPADAPALIDYTEQAAAFAAAVSCKSLVFGCPRGRVMPAGGRPADAIPFFSAIVEKAARYGVRIALEANPPVYGTNFVNTSAEAFAFARQVPGLWVNYDLGTVLTGGESLRTLAENLPLVSHIHISEPEMAPIARRPLHRELAVLLADGGYEGFVSIEMKTQPDEVLEPVLDYIAEVFR